ncbi:glycoside hydrolase family 3 N-terminal domain-containing protein [Fulvivirga sp. M361]|uniref:glycoside hydrolase family 3 N-terminal domain-containing protein n=1 Tax=Fulvivirga sp. M361 TaxID=2594266 RepID=UPI001C88D244|nr:glycoside hydrolase family 3 N-terminal domain-containing protein [Fulvivirga sp. M361]
MKINNIKKLFFQRGFCLLVGLIALGCTSENLNSGMPVYKDKSAEVSARVDNLLSLMTIEEKVAQMECAWNTKTLLLDENFDFDATATKENFPHGLGQVGRPSDVNGGLMPWETARLTNSVQKYFIEETRLGIPVVFHEECLHGQAGKEATSFSQPIGLAATFDTDLVERLYTMVALETRSLGAHQALTPVVDVAREPRWGRVEETYGEDPHLAAQIGIAAVKGFQGDGSFKDKTRLVATLKHLAGHGQPESGMNISPANYSERVIREIFLHPFKEIIKNTGALSLMASYNEIDGVPSHANQWLLRDVLREEWGFQGYVVSDYYALRELNDREGLFGHGVAKDTDAAAKLAVAAGINIELPERDVYHESLLKLIKAGEIEESAIDKLVGPMLAVKFKLGLFDDPYVDPEEARITVGNEAHRVLALEAARKTITLLQNKDNTAPVNKSDIGTIAVIGPNAKRTLLGGYSGEPKYNVNVLEGIRQKVGESVEVLYAEGCKITTTSGWTKDTVELENPEVDRQRIREAVKVARQADVVILAIGGNEQTSREAWSATHMGDRTDLQMVGLQDELIDALAATGKPIVAFVFNGRPLAFTNLISKVPTVFECWYLGQETGGAVADVLFGDYNPGGKLPISIPRSVGHIPAYYNYKPSARRGYLFDHASALYPFGFGLSYTTFKIADPVLSSLTIAMNGQAKVSVAVTNTGDLAGDEVVQLYIRDQFSSVTRPVKELKGFKRIHLAPGETQTIEFDVSFDQLAFYDINMNYVVEPGSFDLLVGNSSKNEDLKKVVLTVEEP